MDFADDAKASPFVRAAACDALLRGSTITPDQREAFVAQRVRRNGSAALLQGLALFPLFYCAIRFHATPLFSWLGWWPLRMLGLISYTFYLVHEAAIDLAGDHLGLAVDSLGRGLAGLAFAVLLSAACYVLVERRFAALRRKLHGKPAAHAV